MNDTGRLTLLLANDRRRDDWQRAAEQRRTEERLTHDDSRPAPASGRSFRWALRLRPRSA